MRVILTRSGWRKRPLLAALAALTVVVTVGVAGPASAADDGGVSDKFQIARAVVIAEQQYITYQEFLPAMGISLPAYQGYRSGTNPSLGHEFASTGYRAHSQIHGEIEMLTNPSRYSQATLDALEAQGVELAIEEDEIELAVPLSVGFFNPDLVLWCCGRPGCTTTATSSSPGWSSRGWGWA